MPAEAIPGLEGRARRGGNNRRRPNNQTKGNKLVLTIIVILVVLLAAGAGIWWQMGGSDSIGSGSIGQNFVNGPTPQAELPTPTLAITEAQASTTTPAPTFTLAPTTTPKPTFTPSPTATPAPTRTPTPIPPPHLRHIAEKQYMLELINAERQRAGVGQVTLGDNIAAQLHAESALQNCTSAHWGVDGLKPYMRYSLAGGYQSNSENASGSDYCIRASDGYRAISSIRHEIKEAMDGWMSSPGHRRNILDPHHKKVNIGISWDRYNSPMFQHFEGGYVKFGMLPSISGRILSLSGKTGNGVQFRSERDLSVHIYYDPTPNALARGQLARTYCYDGGRRVAGLREPLTGGYYWPTDEFTTTYDPCPSPYAVPADAKAPGSRDEAHQAWRDAYRASQSRQPQSITVPWITALEWTANGDTFSVRADISQVLEQHGNGVYTIVLWGEISGARTVISEYAIFHGTTPPDTYGSASR